MLLLSARLASNASASTTSMTFASSSIPRCSVPSRAAMVAPCSWPGWRCHVDRQTIGRELCLFHGGGIHHRRSFFTRPDSTPMPTTVAASSSSSSSSDDRGKKGKRSDRRRRASSSSSSTSSAAAAAAAPRRRILPSEMAMPSQLPPPLPLSRRGQRQWQTLLEDEVRESSVFFLRLSCFFSFCRSSFLILVKTQQKQSQHPLREEDIPPEIRAIMNRLREAGEFDFAFCARSFSGNAKKSESC